jgi:nucleotide-binding universal stress UspA family protein
MATSARRRVERKASKWTGYHRILWPTDFSALAQAALSHAVGLASVTGAELVLLHVLPPLTTYVMADMSGTLWAPLQRKTRAAAQRQLLRLETQVKGPSYRTRTVLTEGVPFYEIVQVAKRLQCDLIVLATHGRTGFVHAIMGSVAENVIRRARCPVLTIHPPRFRRGF